MKCIKILTDKDFGLENLAMENPRERLGARGIVFNEKNEIAILNLQAKNEYKLVGGGIEENERPEDAFKREVKEETGCEVVIDKLLGTIIENKSKDNFKQTSYVYVSHVISDRGETNYTDDEKDDDVRLLWLPIKKALLIIKESENRLIESKREGKLSLYHTKFVVRRDYEILKYYLNNI